MKSKLLLAVAFLSIVLTSCTAKAPVPSSASDPGETAVPTTEHPIPWLDRTLEYLPEVLPEQYREVLSPWDPYTRALLTDGVVIVAPDMKFSSLPQNFRDTLKCIDSDLPYGQYLDADVQEFQDVLCSVYENDDLQIITAYFDPLKEDLYSDAGMNIFGLFTHDRIIFVHTKGFDWVIRRKLIQVKTQVHRFPPGHRI